MCHFTLSYFSSDMGFIERLLFSCVNKIDQNILSSIFKHCIVSGKIDDIIIIFSTCHEEILELKSPENKFRNQLTVICTTHVERMLISRVKSGIFGQTAKFGQPPCLFFSSVIGIKIN